MPYVHLLPDPGMNYTLNRPLLDGTSPSRLKEIGAVAPRIKDYESWHTVWLELARRAEAENAGLTLPLTITAQSFIFRLATPATSSTTTSRATGRW